MRSKQLNEIFRFLANTGVREHEETRHDSGLFCHVHDSAGTCLDDQLIFVCASVETQLLDSLSQIGAGHLPMNSLTMLPNLGHIYSHSFHERVDSVLPFVSQLIFGELHSTAESAVSALPGRLLILSAKPIFGELHGTTEPAVSALLGRYGRICMFRGSVYIFSQVPYVYIYIYIYLVSRKTL